MGIFAKLSLIAASAILPIKHMIYRGERLGETEHSFFDLECNDNTGKPFNFSDLRNKKAILISNVASK